MHPVKYLWGIRALCYKFFLGHVENFTYIGKPLFIEGCKNITIGKRVRIFPGIRMEAHMNGAIRIEDNVYIGQNCHITSEDSELIIGQGTAVMSNVCITNIDHNYQKINYPILEQGYTTRETSIGENCFIGHNAVIQAGVKLGKQCIVGAGSVVMGGGYSDYSVLVGAPAKVVKKYDSNKDEWTVYK